MRGDTLACIRKASNGGEGSLRECQSPGKMGGGGKVQNKKVAQPAEFLGGVKYMAVQSHRRGAGGPGGIPLKKCKSVNPVSVGNGEIHFSGVCNGPYTSKGCL